MKICHVRIVHFGSAGGRWWCFRCLAFLYLSLSFVSFGLLGFVSVCAFRFLSFFPLPWLQLVPFVSLHRPHAGSEKKKKRKILWRGSGRIRDKKEWFVSLFFLLFDEPWYSSVASDDSVFRHTLQKNHKKVPKKHLIGSEQLSVVVPHAFVISGFHFQCLCCWCCCFSFIFLSSRVFVALSLSLFFFLL